MYKNLFLQQTTVLYNRFVYEIVIKYSMEKKGFIRNVLNYSCRRLNLTLI